MMTQDNEDGDEDGVAFVAEKDENEEVCIAYRSPSGP